MKAKFYTRFSMVIVTILMCSYAALSQTTLEIQIAESADDAEEHLAQIKDHRPVGGIDLTSSDLEVCFDREPQLIGLIFRDVQIPVGATVTNAYVQFQVNTVTDGISDVDFTAEIYGAAEANTSAPFTEDPFSISSRPATTAKVEWALPASVNVGDKTENERTPDLSSIITEIILLEGWASGNNIMIALQEDPERTEKVTRWFESFEGDDPTGAPTLVVVFNEEGGGSTDVNSSAADLSGEIYPNPATGSVYIESLSADKFSYKIYDISGKVVAKGFDITGSTTEVDLAGFTQGLYFVNVISSEKRQIHKLVVE